MVSGLSDQQRSEIMLTNITEADCGVIAYQAVTGSKRPEAERLCIELGGYAPGKGIHRGGLNRALAAAGYSLTLSANERDGFTVATFVFSNEYGKFLIYTHNHVMALIEGDCHNSRGDWHSPIEEAFRVEGPS